MKLYLILSLALLSFNSFSQQKTLPMDESGKYTFVEITELKMIPENVMSANAKRFFKVNAKFIKLKDVQQDTAFFGKGKFILQKGSASIGHPSGEVTYDISIALRKGKYRLILTNYLITPYERDRYGNFVPAAVSTALEKSPDKLNRPEWENNRSFIVDESGKIAGRLKTMMNNTQNDPKPEAKEPVRVSTAKW